MWAAAILLMSSVATPLHGQQSGPLQDARQAMEDKRYSIAEQLYRKALIQTPSSPELLTDLGLSLQMQGRSTEAMRYYSMALRQRYAPETYALLAQEKCRIGDFDDLPPMLDRIYHEERKNMRVLSAVAPCYLDIDRPIESAEVYQALLAGNEYPADLALVQLAKSYIRSGQFFAGKLSKAPRAQPFLDALRQAPTAGASGARGAFPEAEQTSPYFRPDLSWDEAVARWRQHPQDTSLLYLLSVLSAEEGMHQIEMCDERYPASPYIAQFHADVLADQGRGDEAAAEYEQLLQQHPELPELHYSLGLLEEKRGEWEKAEEAFRTQLAQSPRDERAAAHLSNCMLQAGKYAELQAFLEHRIGEPRPPQWASLDLAEAEQKLGNPQAAIRILVTAERDANCAKLVHFRLMHLYTLTGHPADAQREQALFQSAPRK
jgi:tetratricopeptide (TPR) repeat protein